VHYPAEVNCLWMDSQLFTCCCEWNV